MKRCGRHAQTTFTSDTGSCDAGSSSPLSFVLGDILDRCPPPIHYARFQRSLMPDWYPPRPRGHPEHSTIASRALRAGCLTSPLRTSPSDSTDVGLEKASVRIRCWTQRQDGGRAHGRAGAPHRQTRRERDGSLQTRNITQETHTECREGRGRFWRCEMRLFGLHPQNSF